MTINTISQPIKTIGRNLGLGRLIYKLFYAPRGFIHSTLERGALNRTLAYMGRVQMESAVSQLPVVQEKTGTPNHNIYFMTGHKYWYQTCFCAYSIRQHSPVNLNPVIYDDGSLKSREKETILRLFPKVCLVSREETKARLDDALPAAKFPHLRERRLDQPLIRKLTDFHAGEAGWKLFLDSDMLFFKTPTFLLNWLQNPQAPCYMLDIFDAYGYSKELLNKLADGPLPEKANIGIFGLQSESIDWEQVEYWLKTFLDQEGTHYNVTQGLSCLYLAGKNCSVAPQRDYLLLPDRQEAVSPSAIMHHYVAESKPWYFRYGWKNVIRFNTSR